MMWVDDKEKIIIHELGGLLYPNVVLNTQNWQYCNIVVFLDTAGIQSLTNYIEIEQFMKEEKDRGRL